MANAARRDRFRKLERDAFDVIVVGAGTGGLTAAALCARRGKSVLVVDQHYVAGGNATIFKRPGFEFDVGLHYIGQCGLGGAIPGILSAAGAPEVEFLPMDPEGFDTLRFPGLEFPVPLGIERYRDALVGQFPSERRGIDRYVRLLESMRVLQRMALRPSAALASPLKAAFGVRWAQATLGAFLDTCTKDPLLRGVLAGEEGDYAQPPSRASLVLHAALMLHYLDEGGFYPRGGGQVTSDALAAAIEEHGGKLLLSTRVVGIDVAGGRATGVRIENKHLGARTVRAKTVISNADIKQTLLKLLPAGALRDRTTARASGWEMSPALGVAYLGAKRDVLGSRTDNTNYWNYPSTDLEREYAAVRAGRFVDEPMIYVSIASLKDPDNTRLAPEGIVNLQLMGLVPSQPEAWGVSATAAADGSYAEVAEYQEHKRRFAQRAHRTVAELFPKLADNLVFQEVSTPLTHTRYTASTGGTSYGLALTPEQFLHRRPGTKTEIDGLLLCGASTRTGHGIMGAMMGGLLAAAEVVGRGVVREALGSAEHALPGGDHGVHRVVSEGVA